jgi:hypothetical protein
MSEPKLSALLDGAIRHLIEDVKVAVRILLDNGRASITVWDAINHRHGSSLFQEPA